MSIQQLGDLLSWSARFHHSLAEQYAKLAQDNPAPRVRMVLDYLADHEREIERGLQQHIQHHKVASDGQWLRMSADIETPDLLEQKRSGLCCGSEDELTEQAVNIHEQLKHMYANLAEQAELPESRELLLALRDHEESETRRLVRDVGRFELC